MAAVTGVRRSELGDALRVCRSAFLGVGVMSCVINLLYLTGSIFMLEVYDRVLPSRSVPTLVGLAFLASGLYIAQGVLDLIRARILGRIGTSLDESLNNRVFETIVRLPLTVGARNEGLQPLRDLDNVRTRRSQSHDRRRQRGCQTRAQAKGKITETELQIIQIDKDMIAEVSKDLRETNDKIGEFVERKVTAEDQLRRVDIRAPQDGIVEQSNVHTIGGVITAGDAIMLIVPEADDLQVEAKVNPQDIDKLQVGQKTLLRLSAFNQRTTPELNGVVTRVSPDVTTDQRTGQSYYTIRVSMPPEEVARLGEVKLIPGMPVEAFVQTGERTMLSYLMKPLSDQLMRAFREK